MHSAIRAGNAPIDYEKLHYRGDLTTSPDAWLSASWHLSGRRNESRLGAWLFAGYRFGAIATLVLVIIVVGAAPGMRMAGTMPA